ncbi:LytR family transcriptional regulator [Amycolatopsis alkalitolerans]|uniref:LytR family transcriptional regulator n=1 Tax=Amycolatopsis alkalitolerans TaxID=2547244 RepID=A0A5C4LS43_9PSEU|nr:LytR family transcriptional regulator [Amycolatopsis alkalitolerans]
MRDRFRDARRPRGALRVAQALVAAVSLLVFGGVWYGWTNVDNALTHADVIDPGAKTSSGPQNILLVGIDTRVDAQGNPIPPAVLGQLHAGSANDGADATDTMIVIHIPADGGKATGFSIPRDSYVQLAGRYGKHKINSAYTYAETAAVKTLQAQGVSGAQLWLQAAQAGAKNSIQTVEQFTGLTINHYAAVNLVGFYDISEAIGGVQVCLKHATRDSYSGADFPAGVQTIQGRSALAFVRQRHGLPNGDLDRIKRQQVFMAAMAKTVTSAGTLTNPAKLDGLLGAIKKSITVDQDWDLFGFAQRLRGITGGDIQFLTIPVVSISLRTPEDGDAVEVDPQHVRAFIAQQITGTPAPSSPAPSTPTSSAPGVTVDVFNANGATGLAAHVLDTLAAQGYAKGEAVTVANRRHSTIDYARGEETAARAVAKALGGMSIVPDSALPSGHVRVYLGRDYAGAESGTTPQAYVQPAATGAPPADPVTAGGVPCID